MRNDLLKKKLFATTLLAGAVGGLWAGAAVAQDADDDDVTVIEEVEEEDEARQERVVVTGSRIARDTFSAPQSLQVIDAGAARGFGLIDTASLLQDSVAASGQQIDGSLNTASGGSNATERPPNNGPGSATIGLRGLDAERTLVLVNGRRLAPAGAGGVPTRPDLNLLPSSLVDRIEILTGGASATYGADAVAGVVNIITKKEFDGFEVGGYLSQPEQSGGEESQISFITGVVGDRGSMTFAGEYYQRTRIAVKDRDFAECERFIADVYDGDATDADDDGRPDALGNFVTRMSPCFSGFPDASAFTSSGLEFYTPGLSEPFSAASSDWSPRDGTAGFQPLLFDGGVATGENLVDRNAWLFDLDPVAAHEFGRYNDQDEKQNADLFTPLRRFTLYTAGDYDADIFGHASNLNFEAFYTNRQVRSRATPEQALPYVPGEIPQLNATGDDFLRDSAGDLLFFDNPLSPFTGEAEGILILDEDFPQVRNTEVEQIRISGGANGELGILPEWTYDLFASYDRTIGFLAQDVLYEPNVFAGTSLQFLDSDGNITCGINPAVLPTLEPFVTFYDIQSLAANPNGTCTPINWFAESVLEEGRFETQAERDFLASTRINRTLVEQSVFSSVISGPVWELQGGDLAVALGAEYRIDKIKSTNDVIVTKGLQASETVQSEGNAQGETFQIDYFAEVDLPILRGLEFADELSLNLATRYTEEKNFGSEVTYTARGTYAPVDFFKLRGSYATAFRAPNLREQFLAQNASGTVPTSTDPCYVPNLARDEITPGVFVYNAAEDRRDPALLAKCVESGADPTQLGISGFSISAPTFTTGETSLDPETADTWEAGFVLTNPFDEYFDGDLSVTFWNIQVEDTVEELGAAAVIFGCFFNFDTSFANDPLCSRIGRSSTGDPTRDYINSVQTSFVNIGKIDTSGVDIDFRVSKDVDLFGEEVTLGLSSTTVVLDELIRQLDADDPDTGQDFAGTILSPEIESRLTLSALWGDWNLRWRTAYTSGEDVSNADDDQNPFFNSSFCGWFGLGFTDLPGGQNPNTGGSNAACRSVDYTDDYFEHSVSLGYSADTWGVTVGVSNVFDEDPPLIDGGLGDRNNVVTSAGYDVFGRSFFVDLTKRF